nr:immunoglobulin light chain junction region [Macaca mulatta]MOV68824.1 immunoglobulin light chain junction region [Macaca mulatta]MOV70646.1 immunoglobulin light chain junction region [Macaca mulatta]MOV71088.1 immunoglobulin light chain junction region [Macaca mulatta]
DYYCQVWDSTSKWTF